MDINIIPFTAKNKAFVKDLNYEWLQKYFAVEPHDELQLQNPQEEIIDKGGLIFYAEYAGEIVGTSSLLKISDKEYELGKMAVTKNAQGKGIGIALMEFCINKAKELGADKIILYSNTKLTAAIALYEKYGFTEIPMNAAQYKRANIKMQKLL
jgi:GNAT superfamily N-acetyltransferase